MPLRFEVVEDIDEGEIATGGVRGMESNVELFTLVKALRTKNRDSLLSCSSERSALIFSGCIVKLSGLS